MSKPAAAASELAPLGQAFRASVIDALRKRLAARGLDGILLLSPANVAYACGFHFSVNERPVGLFVPADRRPVLFVPELERENAEPIAAVELATYEEFPGPVHPVLWMVRQSRAKRLAVDTIEAALLRPLESEVARLELDDLVAPLRFIKTPQELALTREAASFADLCLERLIGEGGAIISQGGTELDLLADCVGFAKAALKQKHGARFDGTPMGITASVHSGPRAALPHGAVTARRPQRGETLIAGIGASLGGYHAESGITLIVGEISKEQRRVMTAMQACNDAAVAALRPGAACEAVNRAALAELEAAGLKSAIRHRIGHGMGLQGHEAPWLAPGDATPVAENMVFSNEPGVYRPGIDGYRTINTMIVGADGVEIPSRFQTDHPIDARVIAI